MLTCFIILSLASGYAGDGVCELFQGLEVVAREEHVYVRERGGNAAGEGLVARGGLQGVHPDYPVGETRDTLHALREHLHVPTVPAVGEDDHHRAAGHPTLSPAVRELLDGVAEAGPA